MTKSQFYGNIESYDVHTYYNQNIPEQKEFAYQLREKVKEEFKDEIETEDIRVHKFWEAPIGPHPICMWEIDFRKPELFPNIVSFYQVNHGDLSVLIHPRSDKGDLTDHTKHALWLGHKQRLATSLLK